MTSVMTTIHPDQLATATGGASTATNQADLRALAKDYCPDVYAKFKSAKTITRAMGERCLDEAGYGSWKSSLDRYFPKQR